MTRLRFSDDELAAMAWALSKIDAVEAEANAIDQSAIKSALEKVTELQSRRKEPAK